ncbi:outer membrane protein, partial [Bacteroides heparinolyticus]
MKKIIAILCMAVIVLNSAAQSPLSFHAKAGIGTSRFHGKDANSETKIAYKAGIGAEYALNKTWVVQSALEFVSIGGKDEIGHIHGARMNELYLQLPVTLAARLHLGKNYHASLAAGPY